MKTKKRIDVLLVEKGLAASREKAKRLIMAGQVRADGQTVHKASVEVTAKADLTVEAGEAFVSRGGTKLEEAFQQFDLNVRDRVCMDIGASTGGFTDCLLQHGAAHVFAVDVGHGQLAWSLRNDDRVTVMEQTNARYLTPDMLSQTPSFCVIDVSFISLTKILPAVSTCLPTDGGIVSLIKPQFEAGREQVQRGGVVRDPEVHREVIERIRAFGTESAGLEWQNCVPSPIKGPAGNTEFLAWWNKK